MIYKIKLVSRWVQDSENSRNPPHRNQKWISWSANFFFFLKCYAIYFFFIFFFKEKQKNSVDHFPHHSLPNCFPSAQFPFLFLWLSLTSISCDEDFMEFKINKKIKSQNTLSLSDNDNLQLPPLQLKKYLKKEIQNCLTDAATPLVMMMLRLCLETVLKRA